MSAARLSPTRCALAEGEPIPFHGLEYFGLITLASRGFRVLSSGSSGEPAVFAQFWLRQSRMVLRPHLYCLPSRFTYRGVPLLVFRLVWYLILCFFCSVCADYADGSGAGSCSCLAQCCRCGSFFPNYAVFALVLGISVLGYGFWRLRFYSLAALMVWPF